MQDSPFLLLFYVQTGCSETESTEANQGLDDVVINEFVAMNTSDFVDEDGAASDWIELRNRGNTDVLLDGWYLTDDASEPRKWGFPAVVLRLGLTWWSLHPKIDAVIPASFSIQILS